MKILNQGHTFDLMQIVSESVMATLIIGLSLAASAVALLLVCGY